MQVHEQYGSRAGPILDAQGKRRYRREYHVVADTPEVNEPAIRAALTGRGLYLGAPHPGDPGALLDSIDPEQNRQQRKIWSAKIGWSSDFNPENAKSKLDRPPTFKSSFVPAQRVVEKDLDGKVFKNSAGTPLQKPPAIGVYHQQITIGKHETSYDYAQDLAYINVVNSDSFLSADPKHAVITNIEREVVWEEKKPLIHSVFTILISDLPLDIDETLDIGPVYRDLETDFEIVAKDEMGVTYGGNVFLDGLGAKLDDGAAPYFLKFRIRNKKPFKKLIKL